MPFGQLLLHLVSVFSPVDTEYLIEINFLLDYKGAMKYIIIFMQKHVFVTVSKDRT